MNKPTPAVIYHFTPAAHYDGSGPSEDYCPAYYEEEGFIHATAEPEWVERMANKILKDMQEAVYLLEIETAKVRAETIMEQAKNGHWFPHIFGGLNRDAVRRKVVLQRGADGLYVFPAEWLPAAEAGHVVQREEEA